MWNYIAKLLFVALLSYALRPRPQLQPPATLEEIESPTAEDGRPIPVVFGRRRLTSPNVVWYGDLKTKATYEKGGKK